MENVAQLFGSFDQNIKLIEREFGVKITCRDRELKIDGDIESVSKAGTAKYPLLYLPCQRGIGGKN